MVDVYESSLHATVAALQQQMPLSLSCIQRGVSASNGIQAQGKIGKNDLLPVCGAGRNINDATGHRPHRE